MGLFRVKRFGATGVSARAPSVYRAKTTYPDNWAELRLQALERDGYKCRKCNCNLRGVFYREVHHILPLSRGGSNRLSNLISLCTDCHELMH